MSNELTGNELVSLLQRLERAPLLGAQAEPCGYQLGVLCARLYA